jgi:hypothetical protein
MKLLIITANGIWQRHQKMLKQADVKPLLQSRNRF